MGTELHAFEQHAQHDVHLHVREGGADAAADTAAERDPRVGVGQHVEEAVGVEVVGVLEQLRVVVREACGDQYPRANRQAIVTELERLTRVAARERDYGPRALHLADGGLAQRLAARVHLLDEPRDDLRVTTQPLHRPAEGVGGRLVSSHEHRHELIAKLSVAHRGAVLVARLHHQREHVRTTFQIGVGLGERDQLVEHVVDAPAQLLELRPGRPWAEVAAQLGRERDARAERGPLRDQLFERLQLRTLGAEHRAQDRAQRDPLHRRRRFELDLLRPAVDLLGGDRSDHRLVLAHALALERRQQQLALLHVLLLVDAQHRVFAQQFAQRAGGAGVQHGGVRAERLLDQLRVGHDHGRTQPHHAQREHRAVAASRALQIGTLTGPHRERLHAHRQARTRRQAVDRRRPTALVVDRERALLHGRGRAHRLRHEAQVGDRLRSSVARGELNAVVDRPSSQ